MLTESVSECNQEEANDESLSADLPSCRHHVEIGNAIERLVNACCLPVTLNISSRGIVKHIDLYLEQPTLLLPHLPGWVTQLAWCLQGCIRTRPYSDWQRIIAISRVIYTMCKTCGAGSVLNHFGCHQVEQVVPTLRFACHVLQDFSEREDLGEDEWIVRYVAILMASRAILVPFDFAKFGSRLAEMGCPESLMGDLHELVISRLCCNGRERQAAVLFITSMIRRRDPGRLDWFIQWVSQQLVKTDTMHILGPLECLCAVAKQLTQADLEAHQKPLQGILDQIDAASFSLDSPLLRRCRVKVWQRLCKMTDPTIALNRQLANLTDRDTIVRWSAAKGVARIAHILSQECQMTIVQTLLSTLSLQEEPAIFHGCALALAELLRQGLVPREMVWQVMDWAIVLVRFQVSRGRYAVGGAVRDAACYMVWAASRAGMLGKGQVDCVHGQRLGGTLLSVALFDREVQCRRAAAAALQELVGRTSIVPFGIGLLNVVDFFNVSQRTLTFESLAEQIAKDLPIYLPAMLDHLVEWSLRSWDRSLRQMAAALLPRLLAREVEGGKSIIGPLLYLLIERSQDFDDLSSQHGALLALANLCPRAECLEEIAKISVNFSQVSSKILGWELLAEAICQLIKQLASLSQFTVSAITLASWLSIIQTALRAREESLHRLAAMETLRAVANREAVQSSVMAEFFRGVVLPTADKDRSVHAQRGFTLAIGSMPHWLFLERFIPLSNLLCKFVTTTIPVNHVEKRCNAVIAIGLVYSQGIANEEAFERIKDALLGALQDYTVDARGDVGSHLRMAAMETLVKLQVYLSFNQRSLFIGCLLQHMVDKLDRLRRLAVKILSNGSHGENIHLPALDWNKLEECHHDLRFFFAQLDPIFDSSPHLHCHILTGLVSSAGSVNPLVSEPALGLLQRALESGKVQSEWFMSDLEKHVDCPRLKRPVLLLLERLIRPRMEEGTNEHFNGQISPVDKGNTMEGFSSKLNVKNLIKLSPPLLGKVIEIANDPKSNIHDILAAVHLLVAYSEHDEHAKEWITRQGANHSYPRVRDLCQSSDKADNL